MIERGTQREGERERGRERRRNVEGCRAAEEKKGRATQPLRLSYATSTPVRDVGTRGGDRGSARARLEARKCACGWEECVVREDDAGYGWKA